MPIAKTKLARVRQVRRWLEDRFPPPRPVRLLFEIPERLSREQPGGYGSLDRGDTCDTLRINPRHGWTTLIDTLIHEWAHARAWSERKPHTVAWGAEYARIYSAFFDSGGHRDSQEF